MKIFHKTENFSSKVNFVDTYNVFLGYDTEQDCCEYADWFISEKQHKDIPESLNQPDEMDGWVFDIDYFEKVDNEQVFDEGEMVVFRITKGKEEKFLHLFNCHNGYYGHGFSFGIGKKTTRVGCI